MAILFYEDWYKPENARAIIDLKTTNTSFIRVAGIYKKMGIKNHAFLLALHNPELQGVDPHDPNLTIEQKILVAKEIKENPWYYFREVMRVPPPAGTKPIMYKANRANIATIWLALNHITGYLIQPRQTGKSLTGDGLDSYMLNILANNTNLSLVTKDEKLRTKTSLQVRELIQLLPPYLQMLKKKDIKNNERITIKELGNSMNLYVGRNDKKAADNLGRGMTSPLVRIDEFAYIYNINITLPVLLAATTAAREVAKESGSPYFTLFTTTPGKLNIKEGQFAYDVYRNSARWTEKMLDAKNEEELNNIVEKNSGKYKVVLLEFNHKQLGFTDEWLKERLRASLADGEQAESDFFMKWVAGNMRSPIPKDKLKIIVNSTVNNTNTFISKYGYILEWVIGENELAMRKRNEAFIIGLDTSDALGNDNDDIGLVITSAKTGEVIAGGKYNETNLASFADFLVELLEMLPRSILMPERRSSATAILDFMFRIMVTKKMNPFKRIFNWVVNNKESYSDADRIIGNMPTIATLSKYKKQFGFATAGSGETSRSLLYGSVFKMGISYTTDTIRYKPLIDQLASLRIKNNRIDHQDGGHDDLVVSWLLTLYVIIHGKHLESYGFKYTDRLNMMVDSDVDGGGDPARKQKVQKQLKIKNKIEQYLEQLKQLNNLGKGEYVNEDNGIRRTNDSSAYGTVKETLALNYMAKIKMLESKLDTSIITNLNIDGILDNIKLAKKIKSKLRVA